MTADPAVILRSLLERLTAELPAAAEPAAPAESRFSPTLIEAHPMGDPILEELVIAYFTWETGEKRAATVPAKIASACVDFNELRICLPSEITAILGTTYPRATERCERLRATLNDIYEREHDMSLASLAAAGKRDARQYLDSLVGIPPFVAARTALVALDCHAFPIDERLCRLLASEDALPASEPADTAPVWIERQIRAGEARSMYAALEAWANDHKPSARTKTSKKKPARTKKKTSTRKTRSKKPPASSDS